MAALIIFGGVGVIAASLTRRSALGLGGLGGGGGIARGVIGSSRRSRMAA